MELAAKGLLGGVFVLAFALLAEMMTPKRFSGVFSAAPSVALGGLVVTVLLHGVAPAREATTGMMPGALGFTAYCLAAPPLLRRWGALRGASAALLVWLAVSTALLPVFIA